MKLDKSVEDSHLLLKGVSEKFKIKLKNKNKDFLVCYYIH